MSDDAHIKLVDSVDALIAQTELSTWNEAIRVCMNVLATQLKTTDNVHAIEALDRAYDAVKEHRR